MQHIGRTLIILGLVMFAVGALVLLAGKLNLPFGRLPGDITYHRKNLTVFAPIGTMLLISVVLSVILNIFSRWKH